MGALTSFVGRQDDRREVSALLRKHQLVTLTGPGGIGKTRLADELADELSAGYPGGAVVVELGPASDGDDLRALAARQLGYESLDAFLVGAAGVATLVIVDNCEHIPKGAQLLVGELAGDTDLTVLTTSRIPLNLPGEHVVALMPLDLPDDDYSGETPALRLFLDRADAAGATWPRSPENLSAAAEIVRKLDGIPLAIELAAARSRMLAPGELVGLLARQLDLLDDATAAGPPRQRSIRSAIFSSYEPLEADLKALFRQLSLLPAPADLGLIHSITGDDDQLGTLNRLSRLVEHSLLQAIHDDNGRTKYRLLEPVRAFAHEQLDVTGDERDASERYIAGITSFADEVVALAMISFSAEVIDRIADRYSHLIAAIQLVLERDEDPSRAFRLFLPFYAPTGAPRSEIARLGDRIRATWVDDDVPLRAEAFAVMAHSSMWAGDGQAMALAAAAIEDPGATALARTIGHRVLAFSAGHDNDRPKALHHIEAALTEAAELSGAFLRELRMSWASLVDDPARRTEAIELLEAASIDAAEHQEIITLVWATVTAAHHHLLDKNLAAATRAAERAQELAERTDAPWATGAAHRIMGSVFTMRQDWDAAFVHWGNAFESVVRVGDIEGVALTLRSAAGAAEYVREFELAQQLWELVPPRRGASALPPLFGQQQADLRDRLGTPIAVDMPQSVRAARQVFRSSAPTPTSTPRGPDFTVSTIRFGFFELDVARRELRRDGGSIHVEPQVFDVLVFLAQRAGQLVTKEEILDHVWGDRFVSASALTTRIKSARAATGDDGTAQNVIRTVHGKGFMFVAPLR